MRNIKTFAQFEAIGFKTPGDNRDDFSSSGSTKLGFKPSESLNGKVLSLMGKLKEMADRGEPGERDVAKRKLKELSLKYGISLNSLDTSLNRLGFKFSWEEDSDFSMNDIDKEIRMLP